MGWKERVGLGLALALGGGAAWGGTFVVNGAVTMSVDIASGGGVLLALAEAAGASDTTGVVMGGALNWTEPACSGYQEWYVSPQPYVLEGPLDTPAQNVAAVRNMGASLKGPLVLRLASTVGGNGSAGCGTPTRVETYLLGGYSPYYKRVATFVVEPPTYNPEAVACNVTGSAIAFGVLGAGELDGQARTTDLHVDCGGGGATVLLSARGLGADGGIDFGGNRTLLGAVTVDGNPGNEMTSVTVPHGGVGVVPLGVKLIARTGGQVTAGEYSGVIVITAAPE